MKKALVILISFLMILSVSSCDDKEASQSLVESRQVAADFFDSESRYFPDEENELHASEATEGGFLIKEKHFIFEYRDYILFDVMNESGKNYDLTVHAKYFDAEGKRLDETWEIYSNLAASDKCYILLDPKIKFDNCIYDFTIKENDSECWQSEITSEVQSINHGPLSKDTLFVDICIKNNSSRNANINFKGVLIFDSVGEIFTVIQCRPQAVQSGQENYFSGIIAKAERGADEVPIPGELADGYIGIPVIGGIAEVE